MSDLAPGKGSGCGQMAETGKKIRTIKVNLGKCNGCRACELSCAAFHARPKYSSVNPARSRIRVIIDEQNDEFVPIRSCDYTKSECTGRRVYTIDDKEYSECSFCGTICPSRDLFREPDSGLPLKCDMCEDDPRPDQPLCVQACTLGALTYEEKEGPPGGCGEEAPPGEMELGLKSLAEKYGLRHLLDAVARIANKGC